MSKIRMTAVSYLNTKPLLFGLVKSGLSEKIDLHLDIPSVCAKKLVEGEADLGLVPVAIIPELPTPRIVSDYCIGSEGTVRTVGIFSERPLAEVRRIYLDFHSRTSVQLCRYLLSAHWNLSPELLPAKPGFEALVEGDTAALIIGDRAIAYEHRYPFFYDLGEAWKQHSGLPFVYAAWVANRELDPGFLAELNRSFALGLADLPQLMYLIPSPYPSFDLQEYYTKNISYLLDSPKRKALDRFLGIVRAQSQGAPAT